MLKQQHNYKLIVKQVPGNSDKTWFKGQKLCVFCMCFFLRHCCARSLCLGHGKMHKYLEYLVVGLGWVEVVVVVVVGYYDFFVWGYGKLSAIQGVHHARGTENLSPSIMQLFVYLEVTPSIASILELKRKRIKRAIFVGSVTWWGLLRIWMYVWRCQDDSRWKGHLEVDGFIAIYLAFLIVYGVCICFPSLFLAFSVPQIFPWWLAMICSTSLYAISTTNRICSKTLDPKNSKSIQIPKVDWIISQVDQALLLFLEAFWSALGLALVPFHDDLRADPVALLLGVSAKVCAPTDFLASSYSKVIQ